ncbi:MAG: response regulator [Polyangiaceae bacterium]|nr:response regulator [Polyangiaceae bacterium]
MAARVLLLDDNLDLAENVKDVLERSPELAGSEGGKVEIVVAHDAQSGLEIARGRPFDVAIVDVRLPDAYGIDLIAPLRAVMAHGEVVLLTGNATVESAISALRAGAAGFVLKSFRPEELVSTVQQALQKVRLLREREKYERRYDALMNATEVLILGLDVDGDVVFFNAKLAALLGATDVDARGKAFAEQWIDGADRKRFIAMFRDAVAGTATKEFEVGMRDGTGAVRRVLWRLSSVTEDDPRVPDHVYGIGVDATERRALERRAANAEAMNAMAPLAMGLAHEIRNPLNAAVLELHLLGRGIDRIEDAKVRGPMRRRVEIVVGEVRRLERLLTEFLELARPRPPQREPVDLDRVVSDVLDLEDGATSSSKVRVTRDLAPRSTVLGDLEKLKQVVLNLVVNAVDAMPQGGDLTARVERIGDEVVLTLTDSGGGIDPRILAEVFDPFFTTKPAGTGLGLAIVRKIVEQHAGSVVLSADQAKGTTTVTVTIPFALDVRPLSKAPPPVI